MKVLDTTFLIDYLDGVEATKEFYEAHNGDDEHWVVPVPSYAEVLVGEGNLPNGDVGGARAALSWTEPYTVDAELAINAARIADEIPPGGPYLDGPDALIAAVGRQLDSPVVSGDGDLTHPETKQRIDVLEY